MDAYVFSTAAAATATRPVGEIYINKATLKWHHSAFEPPAKKFFLQRHFLEEIIS
jgi:hypothetical protein